MGTYAGLERDEKDQGAGLAHMFSLVILKVVYGWISRMRAHRFLASSGALVCRRTFGICNSVTNFEVKNLQVYLEPTSAASSNDFPLAQVTMSIIS